MPLTSESRNWIELRGPKSINGNYRRVYVLIENGLAEVSTDAKSVCISISTTAKEIRELTRMAEKQERDRKKANPA